MQEWLRKASQVSEIIICRQVPGSSLGGREASGPKPEEGWLFAEGSCHRLWVRSRVAIRGLSQSRDTALEPGNKTKKEASAFFAVLYFLMS